MELGTEKIVFQSTDMSLTDLSSKQEIRLSEEIPSKQEIRLSEEIPSKQEIFNESNLLIDNINLMT